MAWTALTAYPGPQYTFKDFTGNRNTSHPLQDCQNCPAHTWSPASSVMKTNCTCERGYSSGACSPSCNLTRLDHALRLDGKDQSRVLFGQGKAMFNESMVARGLTVAFWLRLMPGSGDTEGSICSMKCGGGVQFQVVHSNTNVLTVYTGVNRLVTAQVYLGVNETYAWAHWALMFNFTGNLSVYKNGEVQASSPLDAEFECFTGLSLGAVNGTANSVAVDGVIDDFAVYQKVLSRSDISGLVSSRHCPCSGASEPSAWIKKEQSLVGLYHFNGLDASEPIDTSGFSNDGARSIAGAEIVRGGGRLGEASCPTCTYDYRGPDGVACEACLGGTYKDRNGTRRCETCPEHSFSGIASPQSNYCKCNKGYTGPDGSTCSSCEIGKYKPESGPASCTLCPQFTGTWLTPYSTFSQGIASSRLTDCSCDPGYAQIESDIACVACFPGTYKTLPGMSTCDSCPPYSFTVTDRCLRSDISYEERNNCNPPQLIDGSYEIEFQTDPASEKAAPRIATANLSDCKCLPGYEVIQGTCSPCPVGMYKEPYGNVSCSPCPTCTEGFSNCTIRYEGGCEDCKNGPQNSEYISPGVVRLELRDIPNAYSSKWYQVTFDDTLSYSISNSTGETVSCTQENCSCSMDCSDDSCKGVPVTLTSALIWNVTNPHCGCGCRLDPEAENATALEWEASISCIDTLYFDFGFVRRILRKKCYKTYYEPSSCSYRCKQGFFSNGEHPPASRPNVLA